MTPVERIAAIELVQARLRVARSEPTSFDQPFLTLTKLVAEWLTATEEYEAIARRGGKQSEVRAAALERMDRAEVALAEAVRR